MRRIFIAINLPGEVKEKLGELEREIQGLFPEELSRGLVKWVKKDNLHITLLFIGSVREEEIIKISEIVKETVQDYKPFSLRLEKICYGPPKKIPPHLIWVELAENKELEGLTEVLQNKMAETGILRKFEQRPFTSHITLGRVKTWQWKRMEVEERPEIERELDLIFEIKSVDVMESVLKRTGAEYAIIQSFRF